MATWIVGDIHGCAEELSTLLDRLALGENDSFVSVGDLFHRGPDPAGVMQLLRGARAQFILGNHELRVLERLGLAPSSTDPDDRPPRLPAPADLSASDLDGDGRQPCDVEPQQRAPIVEFLEEHSGFVLRNERVPHAGQTRDGRDWLCVHAGVLPGEVAEDCSIDVLTSLRRLSGRGHPWWYEAYEGPELVLFGHTPSSVPRIQRARGKLVALGLDTGCVYGGRLSAYSPELDAFESVSAARAYAAR
ncbi:MAG: metallophosphoesterase [Planctomycetes bacterium]|nr:metallophosphoesterase [Planctomycetota bacterium]